MNASERKDTMKLRFTALVAGAALVLVGLAAGPHTAVHAQDQPENPCERQAQQIERDAMAQYNERMRQARALLQGAQNMAPAWWEFAIPLWNVEALIAGTWSLSAATTAQTMMEVARTDLDTEMMRAATIRNQCKQHAHQGGQQPNPNAPQSGQGGQQPNPNAPQSGQRGQQPSQGGQQPGRGDPKK